MPDQRAEVDGERGLQPLQPVAECLPVLERYALREGERLDVLDSEEHVHEPLGFLRVAARRDGETAVASDDRRDAVLEARPRRAVPAELWVVVGVDIDQPRREHLARAVDLPRRRPERLTMRCSR